MRLRNFRLCLKLYDLGAGRVRGDESASMRLNDYQAEVRKTDRAADKTLAFLLFGLFGEVGTRLGVVKKKQRDTASHIGYTPHVIEELCDVLWYFAAIADRAGIRLPDIGHNIKRGLHDWSDTGDASLRFGDLQEVATITHAKPMLISPPDVVIEHLYSPFTEEKSRQLAGWFEY